MEQYPSHFPFIIPLFSPYKSHHLPKFTLIPCSVILNCILKEGKGRDWLLKFGNGNIVFMEVASVFA
jgi:hypothetical protein